MQGRKENEEKVQRRINDLLEYAPSYMKRYWKTLTRKSYTTQHMYIRYVLDFLDYIESEFDIDIRDINSFKNVKSSMVDSYLVDLKNNGDSIKASKLYGIKTFFKYLLKDGYIQVNPCDDIEPPRDNEVHEITSLTKEEIEIIKNNILCGSGNKLAKQRQKNWVKRDYAIIMLALSLGLRVTSITEIDVEDIDFEKNELKIVEKGNNVRVVMFSGNIKNIIIDWMGDREKILNNKGVKINALFVSRQMTRMTSMAISKIVKKYTYNIDKHITPHKLRSTCATNVYNKTGDIYLTADILGHSNIKNTKRYAQINEDRKKKAAQAMDDILF